MIEADHPHLSVRCQCGLLGLNRSSYYYAPAQESVENLELMRLLDEQFMKTPFYGRLRMTVHLQRQGYSVNHKRVQRLMRLMGIEAIYPKPRTSVAMVGHRQYPYLLRDVAIVRPNQVWSTDITYIPMAQGFMYLVVVMDWYSRYVLSWQLSNTLEGSFCQDALQMALLRGKPDIFNSDRAPVRAFIFSGDKAPFPAEGGTAQRLTLTPKGRRGQSATRKRETLAPSSERGPKSKLDMAKAELPEP